MAAIQLTNPMGQPVAIQTDDVILILFSPLLSSPRAKSNVFLDDSIRSFKETRTEVANLVKLSHTMVKLSMPNVGKDRAKGETWLRVDLIASVAQLQQGGASVDMKRRRGPIIVTESMQEVQAAIAAA